jgi:nitrate reductase delta subunit
MADLHTHQDICRRFAVLFSYPDGATRATADVCRQLLEPLRPAAAAHLQGFGEFLEATDDGRIEELFTATFDLQSVCHPYIGYQLCGESQQRGLFLMKLNELYRRQDFTPGVELPDHLSEVLRFVGVCSDQGCRRELIADGLLPTLEKILQGLESEDHPFRKLINALYCFLSEPEATLPEQRSTGR